ncbi:MAG: hypothetical protein ACYDBP_12410 [Leptospirales bacterium]
MPLKTETAMATLRKNRLSKLSDHFGGPYQFSQLFPKISCGSVTGILNDRRGMGDRLARKIEEAVGLPEGWMDGVPGDLPERSADPGKTYQKTSTILAEENRSHVFENLLRALSANPRTVRIDAFTVTLTGIGIDPTKTKKDHREDA